MLIRFNKVKVSDLEQIMKWRMDPEVTKYMYSDPVLNLDIQNKWYEERVKTNPREKYWIINVNNENAGLISLYNINTDNSRAYWAYYIGEKSFIGKGIGKQVELNVMNYVFNTINLNKLCCEVFCFNEAVIKIHQKFGSKIEGTLKQQIKKNGIFYDIVTMGILKEEWIKIKDLFEILLVDIEE